MGELIWKCETKFKKLTWHALIGGCKTEVLHRLLIEFILLNKTSSPPQKPSQNNFDVLYGLIFVIGVLTISFYPWGIDQSSTTSESIVEAVLNQYAFQHFPLVWLRCYDGGSRDFQVDCCFPFFFLLHRQFLLLTMGHGLSSFPFAQPRHWKCHALNPKHELSMWQRPHTKQYLSYLCVQGLHKIQKLWLILHNKEIDSLTIISLQWMNN